MKVKPSSPEIRSDQAKKMVLYARVSSEEQTRGNYPSCDSQVEELEAECLRNGWEAYRVIRDEGFSAGSLSRPGLTEMRWMVQRGEVDGVLCTWYDRLTRSREFYTLDNEFKTHGVAFITLHDAADTRTAAGRFMESMIVAAKTYERDQTSEKVRTKMRMRLEKGLHQGGLVPFGFTCDPITKLLRPDPEKIPVVQSIFEVYVESESDFAVRDWLKAHGVLSPRARPEWSVSSLCDLLSNRRYIAEIVVNAQNKEVGNLPAAERYRIVPAPHEPLISRELFERAAAIRRARAQTFANHGRKRGKYVRHNRCERVFVLQGLMDCAFCGHPMTPHYVLHRAGKGRRRDSFVCHYVCTRYRKAGRACDHANRILASTVEEWVMERLRDLVMFPEVLERVVARARQNAEKDSEPLREAQSRNEAALQALKAESDALIATITSSGLNEALLRLLNERAHELQLRREVLLSEASRLRASLIPVEKRFNEAGFRIALEKMVTAIEGAEPADLQKILRLVVRRLSWGAEGKRQLEMHNPRPLRKESGDWAGDWFDHSLRSDGPDRIRTGGLLRDRQTC